MALLLPHPELQAAILAGGRGTRLGGAVKGALTVGGATLIDRVSSALDEGDRPLLVAHGPIPRDGLGLKPRHVSVPDRTGWRGPLAGIAGALATLPPQTRLLVTVAVDTPFFPPDFTARALALLGDADVVVGRYQGQAYFTNALWRADTLATRLGTAPEGFDQGGIKGLLGGLRVAFLDWPATTDGNPFANVNAAEDLVALERRAAANGVGKAGQTR